MKRANRSDVARLAGVSDATVSYVVNDGPRPVSAETRKRVLKAIEELNYHPHAIARSLSIGTSRTIGFLATNLISPFVNYLVNSVEVSLSQIGYSVILASSHDDPKVELQLLNTLVSQNIAGLMLVPTTEKNRHAIEELIQRGLPVVLIDRYIDGLQADTVVTDNVEAARHATIRLIEMGCKHPVCLAFSRHASSALDRVKGFKIALEEENYPVEESSVIIAHGTETAAALDAHVEKYGIPDGILGTSDLSVINTVKFLRQKGIKVPEQVKVTGSFYSSPWNEILDSPLFIVGQDHEKMAQRAVRYLIERIENPDRDVEPRFDLLPAKYFHETE